MSFLYRKRGIYYLSVSYKGKRIVRSLGTATYVVARKLKSDVEKDILTELITGKKRQKNLPLNKLIPLFLNANHSWSAATRQIYEYSFKRYMKSGFPETNYRAMVVRNLNTLYKWAEGEGLSERKHFKGGANFTKRDRVFNDEELNKLLNEIKPDGFQRFVRFAYYTGARRGEIARIRRDNVDKGILTVSGKTGVRRLKLIPQAMENIEDYDYKPNYITQKFKKELNRLNIDGRFHDLRRTFGLNCMRKGLPIQEISKLLGHSNVQVTLDHYAPFTVDDIEDFIL